MNGGESIRLADVQPLALLRLIRSDRIGPMTFRNSSTTSAALLPRSVGADRLIRNGAHIMTDVDDTLAEIAPMLSRPGQSVDRVEEIEPASPAALSASDSDRNQIDACLGSAPVELDEIARFASLTPAAVQDALLEFDLAGCLARRSGDWVSLVAGVKSDELIAILVGDCSHDFDLPR